MGRTGDFGCPNYAALYNALLTSTRAHMCLVLISWFCHSNLWVCVLLHTVYGIHLPSLRFSEKLNFCVWVILYEIILQSVERHCYFQRAIPLPLRQILKTKHLGFQGDQLRLRLLIVCLLKLKQDVSLSEAAVEAHNVCLSVLTRI